MKWKNPMTYGLDLFSDVRAASMPTTAFIPMSSAVLLGMWAWMRDRRAVLGYGFILLAALFATTAKAADGVQITGITKGTNSWSASCETAIQTALVAKIGTWATDQAALIAKLTADFSSPLDCTSGPATLGAFVAFGDSMIRGTWDSPTGLISRWNIQHSPAPPPCEEGQVSELNLGVGYAKTTANTDDWINPQFHDTACEGQCQVTVGAIVPGSCYVSGIVGPPYPGYCEFSVTTTGNTCTPADEAASATLPAIPCPEGMAAGSVNGISGCYKVSEVTTETTVTDNGDGTTTTTETVSGPTGTTTTTTTCNGEGACSSTTTHLGGGAGTGAPSQTGQPYDGEGTEDEGEGACGKEGLPDCTVKVNEEGTPEQVEGAQATLDGVVTDFDEYVDYLGYMGWVREELPFIWSPSLPSGSCSAMEIYGQPINICEPLGKVRMVWSFILTFMAGLYIWRSGTQAMKG
jgi:hypothetical protein